MNKKIFDKIIGLAEISLSEGNYPVGAAMVIDGKLVAYGRNTAESNRNYTLHAETSMLIYNAETLLTSWKEGRNIDLYSTLEPCLMCLGVAVMNKVNSIYYIQKDPLAGACGIDTTSLGKRYHSNFPNIVHCDVSQRPKEMIIDFLDKQISKKVRLKWSLEFREMLLKS